MRRLPFILRQPERRNILSQYPMTKLRQAILREIATLPENRLSTVLAFIRFLKFGLDAGEEEIEKRFDKSLKSVRARAKKLKITQADIELEIRAVREEQARRA